jgi:hypothetical protein
VEADVQLSLEAQEREEPAWLDLLPWVAVDDERQILAAVDLNVIGTVGKCLTLRAQVAIRSSAVVELREQSGKRVVAKQLTLNADSTKLFDQGLGSQAQRLSKIARNDGRLVLRSIEPKQPGPQQLAAGVDWSKHDENLALINRRFL